MLKYIALAIIALAAVALSAQATKKTFPYDYQTGSLDNGLKYYIIPMESGGLVTYYSVVRTGSRDEWEPGRSGFAHFFEHMMFRGTKKRPQAVYDSTVISLGADANAYTSDDITAYHLNFAAEDLETVIDLESDRFQNLSYKENAFKTESGAVYGEYRKNMTNPFFVLWEKLKETAFTEHTYSHTTIGYEEDIANMPNMYDYSLSFYDRYYRPENVVIVVAGDVKPANVKSLLSEYYGQWEQGYTEPEIKPEPPQTEPRTATVTYPGKTNPYLAVAYKNKAYDAQDVDYIAAQLLGELAFGSNSDLYKKLYLEEQKVQYLGPSFSDNRDPFLNIVYAIVNDESDLDYVRDEIYSTIEKYQTEMVDQNKLDALKSRMKYGFLMGLDTPSAVAGGLARKVAITGGIEDVDMEFETMEKVTPEDIMNAAKSMTEDIRTTVTLKGAK
jgi:zinc protease